MLAYLASRALLAVLFSATNPRTFAEFSLGTHGRFLSRNFGESQIRKFISSKFEAINDYFINIIA